MLRSFGRLVRRHWLLSILLLIGLGLRVITWLAYQPALLYIDSFTYLPNIVELDPTARHPLGYSLILRFLLTIGGLAFVAAVQHLLGLGMAVALYALARRREVPRWISAIVAAVVLLDAYQLQIEQNILSEVWMQAMLVGIMWALIGVRRPGWRSAIVAGLLVGAAIITRTISFVTAAPVLVFLLCCGGALTSWVRWRQALIRVAVGGLAMVLMVGAYASYYHSRTGEWRISGIGSNMLYGRAATFAECDALPLTEAQLNVCPPEPVSERGGVDYYTHVIHGLQLWPRGEFPPEVDGPKVADEFAHIVLREQPEDFVIATLRDFAKNFGPEKITHHNDVVVERWQFQLEYPLWDNLEETAVDYTEFYDGHEPRVNLPLATFLRGYQLSFGYTPGPFLALTALLGIATTFGIGRARHSGLRSAAMLSTGMGLALLLSAASFEFSWRYQLPALVTLPLGGALGVKAFMARRRRPDLAPFPDPVDRAAVSAFEERYGTFVEPAASLVLLIAAYNEEEGIGAVLDHAPRQCGDLPVAVLVVVDGATDDTAAIVADHDAYVADVPANRGQGAALRLGYHLAHRMGADYVVTTDADGQYDTDELPELMAPLLDGSADFVSGSRRMGSEDADSTVRWVGVRVFAVLASILTRSHITDTSFGFRAMRTEDVVQVRLTEPQYQSSQLLLGMLAQGARYRELPLTMRLRSGGKSKKGGNVVYGANYARVMLTTWWRDHVRRSNG